MVPHLWYPRLSRRSGLGSHAVRARRAAYAVEREGEEGEEMEREGEAMACGVEKGRGQTVLHFTVKKCGHKIGRTLTLTHQKPK